jgi:hypothetical protein
MAMRFRWKRESGWADVNQLAVTGDAQEHARTRQPRAEPNAQPRPHRRAHVERHAARGKGVARQTEPTNASGAIANRRASEPMSAISRPAPTAAKLAVSPES